MLHLMAKAICPSQERFLSRRDEPSFLRKPNISQSCKKLGRNWGRKGKVMTEAEDKGCTVNDAGNSQKQSLPQNLQSAFSTATDLGVSFHTNLNCKLMSVCKGAW